MGTKGKKTVDKEMIWVDWMGKWRIVKVYAESDTSVWVESLIPGGPPKVKHKRSTDGQFFEATPDGYREARERLADKYETARRHFEHAAKQKSTFELKMQSVLRQGQEPDPDARRQDAQEETFALARMQEGEE